jgi:hypothetical protein
VVPAAVVSAGEGGMMRFIAYGDELNLAYPPRPADPKAVWEPDWAVKLRQKSTAVSMLGMKMPAAGRRGERRTDNAGDAAGDVPTSPGDAVMKEGAKALRGILGF